MDIRDPWVTNVIFATFTFIFFAMEGSIMAQGLQLGLGIRQGIGYAISTIVIIPFVIYGTKTLAKLQVWATPLWLLLMVVPVGYLLLSRRGSIDDFLAFTGKSGAEGTNLASVMPAAGVCLSLMAQIAEQIDYLRFMPPKTADNKGAWWRAVILAGPGWGFHRGLPWRVWRRHPTYSPIFAVGLALLLPPVLAVLTRGKYYLRRTDDGIDLPMFDADGNPSDHNLLCHVTGLAFERPEMIRSAQDRPNGEPRYASSMALSTDKTGELVQPAQK